MKNFKYCPKCKETKDIFSFNKDSQKKSGRSSYCRDCNKLTCSSYHKNNPLKAKNFHLNNLYGISIEKFNELFQQQNGCCAICKTHQSNLKKALAVDHCHKTKEIRGLLCNCCNIGLGHFKEDTLLIQKAIEYLR